MIVTQLFQRPDLIFFFLKKKLTRVAAAAATASDGNVKCSNPVAGTTADNEVMQQDLILEGQKNNQVRNARSIILIVPCVPLTAKVIAE